MKSLPNFHNNRGQQLQQYTQMLKSSNSKHSFAVYVAFDIDIIFIPTIDARYVNTECPHALMVVACLPVSRVL